MTAIETTRAVTVFGDEHVAGLRTAVIGTVIVAADDGYDAARRVWNGAQGGVLWRELRFNPNVSPD